MGNAFSSPHKSEIVVTPTKKPLLDPRSPNNARTPINAWFGKSQMQVDVFSSISR